MNGGVVLLIGFEPLADSPSDSGALVVEAVAGTPGVAAAVLPAEYDASVVALADLIEFHRPISIIALAEVERSDYVLVERVAWNHDDDPRPDNAGCVRRQALIMDDGPAAIGGGIPFSTAVRAMALAGLPVVVSDHAGRFLANHVYYTGLRMIELRELDAPMLLIGVPPPPERLFGRRGRVGAATARLAIGVRGLVADIRRALGETG